MKNKATKILSLVFAIMMVLSTLSVCSVSSFAEDSTDDVIKGETIWAPEFNRWGVGTAITLEDNSSEAVFSDKYDHYQPLNSNSDNSLFIYYHMSNYSDENPFMLNNNYAYTEKAKL